MAEARASLSSSSLCERERGKGLNWSARILSFAVRAAAVDDFLRDLRAKGAADLNAVLVTLNEGKLCAEALGFWLDREWIAVAPSSPLTALVGPRFSRQLTLRQFCGEEEPQTEATGPEPSGKEASDDDENR